MRSHNTLHRSLFLVLIGCLVTVIVLAKPVDASTKTRYEYQEIEQLYKKNLKAETPEELERLIEKSQAFVDGHPDHRKIDKVHYILGNTLARVDRMEEAAKRFEHLIKNSPKATYFPLALLELGLAYDKLNQHEKANTAYQKLVEHPKHSSRTFGKMAKELLALDKAERTGQLPSNGGAAGQPDALVGKEAFDFQVKDLNGDELSLKAYRGKVVLLDFWATWCGPCIGEMPHVKKVYAKYRDRNFEIVGISLDTNRAKLLDYLDKEGLQWPQFFDGQGWKNQIAEMYQVKSIPRVYLVDGEGTIRQANVRGGALDSAVAKLVEENNAKVKKK